MIEIRTATVVDAKPLAESHDAFVRRCAVWMRRELQIDSAWQAWLAVEHHAIVGQVWLQSIAKIPNPNPLAEHEHIAYLSNLFVKVPSRGGTGTRLVEAALAWCRSNRIDRVILWPSKRSVTLYVGQGFSQGGEVMELKIRR